MNRKDYYFRQLVAEDELDDGFEGAEAADRAIVLDGGFLGVANGLVVAPAAPPDLTVDVAAGTSYDKLGERCRVASTQNVDVSVDFNNVPTAVAVAGNEKWVAVFLKFARVLTDPRLDGNNNTVFFDRAESFSFHVVQGSEALIGTATKPALLADGILLADVYLVQGQTTVVGGDLSTLRREMAFKYSAGAYSVAVGTAEESDAALLTIINGIVAAGAAGVSYAGSGPNWADATGLTSANVEAALDEVVADLGGVTGADKVGFTSGGALFFDGTDLSASTTPRYAIDAIVTFLGQSTDALQGAKRVGIGARSNWASGETNPAGVSVFAAIEKIITDLSSSIVVDKGADCIGWRYAAAAWANGDDFTGVTDVGAATYKIIFDLDDATGVGACGASRVGFAPQGNIAGDTVEEALVELDGEKGGLALDNVWTGASTHTGVLVHSGNGGRTVYRLGTVPDANTDLDVAKDYWRCAAPTVSNRSHTILHTTGTTPIAGDTLRVTRPASGTFAINLRREDLTVIATLDASTHATAELVFDGTDWTLAGYSPGCTPGAGA